MILLLLSAPHARNILVTALPASQTNIWPNLYKWASISLVLVPALFRTARETRLPWFAGRIVWPISSNLEIAAAFYALLPFLWVLEVPAMRIVQLDTMLKLTTECVLFAILPVSPVSVPTLKTVQVVNSTQVTNFSSSKCAGHFVPKDSIPILLSGCALYARAIYSVRVAPMIAYRKRPTAQLACMDTSTTPLTNPVALLVKPTNTKILGIIAAPTAIPAAVPVMDPLPIHAYHVLVPPSYLLILQEATASHRVPQSDTYNTNRVHQRQQLANLAIQLATHVMESAPINASTVP